MTLRTRLGLLLSLLLICCANFHAQVEPGTRIVIDSSAPLSNSEEKSLQKFIHSKHRGVPHGWNLYSKRAEREMGERAEAEIDRVGRHIDDGPIVRYLESVGRTLAAQSSASAVQFRFKVLLTDEVNALSLPNGVIYVNSGLILMVRNESELAGVLAHEIAHVAARHASRAASRRELWGFAGFGLAIATGGVGTVLQPAMGLADGGFGMKFSRDNEREADLLGLTYLDAAGFDPYAYVAFLHRLSVMETAHGKLARMAATHPATQERTRRAERAIELMLPRRESYKENSSGFEWVQRVLLQITHPEASQAGRPVLKRRPIADGAEIKLDVESN